MACLWPVAVPPTGQRPRAAPVACRSGDGTLANVGTKMDKNLLQCSECSQRFDTETALQLYPALKQTQVRHMHPGIMYKSSQIFVAVVMYMDDDTLVGASMAGEELFRIDVFAPTVRDFRAQIAEALACPSHDIQLLEGEEEIDDSGAVNDPTEIILKIRTTFSDM